MIVSTYSTYLPLMILTIQVLLNVHVCIDDIVWICMLFRLLGYLCAFDVSLPYAYDCLNCDYFLVWVILLHLYLTLLGPPYNTMDLHVIYYKIMCITLQKYSIGYSLDNPSLWSVQIVVQLSWEWQKSGNQIALKGISKRMQNNV